jgi:hypothetical protein
VLKKYETFMLRLLFQGPSFRGERVPKLNKKNLKNLKMHISCRRKPPRRLALVFKCVKNFKIQL